MQARAPGYSPGMATKKKDGPCVLTFTKEQGVWKLTSFDGDFSTLRLKL